MLEDMTGTRVLEHLIIYSLKDAAMIGRDPNSGLSGKYGPGSVLSGQNVVSGFGTNDYVGQLQNYIDKMMSSVKLLLHFNKLNLIELLQKKQQQKKKHFSNLS